MTGSDRNFTHDTFEELQWNREASSQSKCLIPRGFDLVLHLLNNELVEILEDIQYLQSIVENSDPKGRNPGLLSALDNMQASIESRIIYSRGTIQTMGPIAESCRLASYICCFTAFAEIWNGSFIVAQVAKDLAKLLLKTHNSICWVGHNELRLWLLIIGGVYAARPSILARYEEMLRNLMPQVCQSPYSWDGVQDILKTFLWSDRVLAKRSKEFWSTAMMRPYG